MPVSGLLFLLTFVPACVIHLLPGAVLLRRRDWGWAVGCLVLGAVGIPLFLPWVAAVIIAARRARFTPLRKGSPVPVLCRILGLGLIVLSLVLISWGVRDYRQAAEISMSDFYANIIINSIVGCVGMLIAGIFLLIVPALRGNGLWGGLMAATVLLGSISWVSTYTLLDFYFEPGRVGGGNWPFRFDFVPYRSAGRRHPARPGICTRPACPRPGGFRQRYLRAA